jgi:hypothetical protein
VKRFYYYDLSPNEEQAKKGRISQAGRERVVSPNKAHGCRYLLPMPGIRKNTPNVDLRVQGTPVSV